MAYKVTIGPCPALFIAEANEKGNDDATDSRRREERAHEPSSATGRRRIGPADRKRDGQCLRPWAEQESILRRGAGYKYEPQGSHTYSQRPVEPRTEIASDQRR